MRTGTSMPNSSRFAFTHVGITLKNREMLTVAMLVAMGMAQGQLEFQMRACLNTGVTRDEIVEIVFQVAVYAGVPVAMNAITAAKAAFDSVDLPDEPRRCD